MATNTIADIVLNNSGGNGLEAFDILLAALQAVDPDGTGLLAAASDPSQDLTVLAPTDEGFIALAQVLDPSVTTEADAIAVLVSASAALSPSNNPTAFLETVLNYHISGGAKTKAELQGLAEIDTLAGLSIVPSGEILEDKDPDLGDPSFSALTDLSADNGLVQVIDGVLLPFDVTFADGGLVKVGKGPDAVIGSAESDWINLGKGDDVANGGDGKDWIRGQKGDDVANGGAGKDKVFGGSGHDSLGGNEGKDMLFGRDGKDFLSGDSGDDMLKGGRHADTLVGGSGDDMLKGGRGADQFVFNPNNLGTGGEKLEGKDVVKDFNIDQGDMLILDVSSFDQPTLDGLAAADGDANELELIDLLTAGVVSLGFQ